MKGLIIGGIVGIIIAIVVTFTIIRLFELGVVEKSMIGVLCGFTFTWMGVIIGENFGRKGE